MSEHPTIEEVYKRPEYFDAVWSKSIERILGRIPLP